MGGFDDTTDSYVQAVQTLDISVEGIYEYEACAEDNDFYNVEFFEEAYAKIKKHGAENLGGFYRNFFVSEGFGLAFNMNNMIYIIDPEKTWETLSGKLTYDGDWFFYYGDGTYGTKLTKEESEAAGTLVELPSEIIIPDVFPTNPNSGRDEEESTVETNQETTTASNPDPETGTYDWFIDENGTLFVSGSGIINPDGYSEEVPWWDERDSIINVVINDGVEGVGDYSFYDCNNLKSVYIPTTVNFIGDCSFFHCTSLETVNVSSNNKYYTSVDGVLFNKNITEIIKYPDNKSGKYIIPNTVTSIGPWSFRECRNLTNLEIPESVKNIGHYSFYDCTALLNLTIPKSVTNISDICGLGFCFHMGGNTLIENFEIRGYSSSAAEDYAENNNIKFIKLDTQILFGDVGGDGEVNAKDRMMLTRHLAKWAGYESVDTSAADLNNDSEVNAKDRMILTRHLAKWQGYETLPYTK